MRIFRALTVTAEAITVISRVSACSSLKVAEQASPDSLQESALPERQYLRSITHHHVA